MRERGSAGDRQHDGRTVELPCQRDLRRRRPVAFGYPGEWRIGPCKTTLSQRIKGNECDPAIGANVDQGVGRTVLQIMAVLDRHDLRHLSRPRQLCCRHVRNADAANLAFPLKVDEGADRILDRHALIDRMKLIELDALESQPPQTLRACATQMFRAAVDAPIARTPCASSRPCSRSRARPDKATGPWRSVSR